MKSNLEESETVRTARNTAASRVAMAALMLLITVGFYWKLALTNQYNWFGTGGDVPYQVLPWFQMEAREWHSGRAPLWDPYAWLGQPLLAQAQPGGAYPLNWLLFLSPLRHGLIMPGVLNWYFIAIHFMAVFFCYALCRDLGRSRSASLIAGCVFGFAGFIGTTDWPQMVNGAVWTPLVLLFLLRAVRGRSPFFSAALSGGFLGIAWLSGHHQIPIYVTLLTAFLWLFFSFQERRANWKILRLAGIAFIAMFLVSALQTLPTYEYGKLALRWSGTPNPLAWDQKVPYSVHAEYSMPGSSLLAIFIPGLNKHADPFVGVVAFALALAGFALSGRERAARIFTTIALAGLLLALGYHNIFHGILYSVAPLMDKARVPSTLVYIFHVGLMVLIALGVDYYFSAETRSPWKLRIAIGCGVFGFVVWGLFFQTVLAAKLNFEFDDRLGLTAFFAILLAGVLYSFLKGRLTRGHAIAAVTLLLLIELGNDSGYAFRGNRDGASYPEKYTSNEDIAGFLKQQPGPFRIDADDNEIPGDFGDWYGIDLLQGLVASVPAHVFGLDWSSDRDKMLLGVAYYVGKKPANAAEEQVFEGSSGLKVFRNAQAFPRAWTVHQAVAVKNMGESNYYIQQANFDLRRTAPIAAPLPKLASCDPNLDSVSFTGHSSQSLTLDAKLACDGMVVISDTYFPGWKVTIDGVPSEIREVYGALRGVVVSQGQHRIRMWYRPRSVVAGSILTFVGMIGICAIGLWERGRARA
ncbi:MAG: YfhO family protein [Bryobacteraceae bacterium]